MTNPSLYLASKSPGRAMLLTQIGTRFEHISLSVNESCRENESAETYVQRLALEKCLAGLSYVKKNKLSDCPVLAADTALILQGKIITKPKNTGDAYKILETLSGKVHQVLTSVVVGSGVFTETELSISEVRFALLSAEQIRAYVETGECFGCAGAYAIQGKAAIFVKEIKGSYSGIVGLPLCETFHLLKQFGIPYWDQ